MRHMINYISCGLTVFCSISILTAYPAGWSDDILLTPEDSIVRGDPDVTVVFSHDVWVVWDSATWVNGTGEVLFSKRDSLGACLIPETPVSNNASYSLGPRVAVDATYNLQFVWRNETPLGMGLWHARLANDGSVIVPSHLAVSGNNTGYPIRMVMNRYNEINVAWNDNVAGYDQISYTKLDSSGNPIIAKMRVSPANVFSDWPGIGVDSFANVHLAYRADYQLAYTKLDRFGNILIDNNLFGRIGGFPTIIADHSQNIHIVYEGWTTSSVVEYMKLDQNGNILVGPLTLSPASSNYVHMAMDSLQYLHVVWAREVEPSGIVYTKLDTNGNYVIPPVSVVYPPFALYPWEPRIAADMSNRLHLVWMDQRLDSAETEDIFYKRGENETKIEEQIIPGAIKRYWISAVPNPFTKQLKVAWHSLPDGEITELVVYDIMGKEMKNFRIEPNNKSIIWFGDDNTGKQLPSGVYFISISSNDKKNIAKVIKLD